MQSIYILLTMRDAPNHYNHEMAISRIYKLQQQQPKPFSTKWN